MAKYLHPTAVLDGLLDKIALGTTMTVCSVQPTTRTEAVTTYALASVAMTGVDYTKAAGDTNGRKVTTAQKSGVSITTTGTATHVAICDATNLLLVTTCTSQALTSGGTVTIPAFKCETADPT